jgi:hypothetical protein
MGGCDAVRGISGAATLSLDAVLGLTVVLISAVITAFVMDAANALDTE